MKKQLSIISAAFALGVAFNSCSDSDDLIPQFQNEKESLSPKLEWVISQANKAVDMFEPSSRASIKRAASSGIKAVVGSKSRADGDTLIYVVNYPDDEGFALISAVDAEDPILAYIPQGHYDPAVGTDNPGFNIFMEAAVDKAVSKSGIRDTSSMGPDSIWMVNGKYRFRMTNIEADTKLGPKLGEDFNWSQDNITGKYCSNKLCGSGPLAVAAAVTYLNAGTNTFLTFNFNGNEKTEVARWSNLFAHKGNVTFNDGCSTNTHDMIGKLCRQIGFDGQAVYSTEPNCTYMNRRNIEIQLRKYLYGYTVIAHKPFTEEAASEILPKGLMLMYGTQAIGNYYEWICDGYKYTRIRTDIFESSTYPDPHLAVNDWTKLSTTYKHVYYNYMHWGWNGYFEKVDDKMYMYTNYNGWFSGNVITYSKDKEPVRNIEYCAVTKNTD